jgi:hypothetical protein
VTLLFGDPVHARCAACDAALADDQRFCLGCGLRCAPDELRLATLPSVAVAPATVGSPRVIGVAPVRRPVIRSAAITALIVLTMGVAIGATIGPATVGETAAAQSPLFVVAAQAPASAPAADDGASSDDGAQDADAASLPDEEPPADTEALVTSSAPATTTTTPTPADDAPPPAAAPPADLVQLAGVVAAVDADTGRVTLVDRGGDLQEIHAAGCGVHPGDDLHVRARRLANGTWAADRMRVLAEPAQGMTVVGTVSWVDAAGGRYALGARGTTLLVTVPPAPSGTPPAAGAPNQAPPTTTTSTATTTAATPTVEPAPASTTSPAQSATTPATTAPATTTLATTTLATTTLATMTLATTTLATTTLATTTLATTTPATTTAATTTPATTAPTATPSPPASPPPASAVRLPAVGERLRVALVPPAPSQAGDPPAPLLELRHATLPARPDGDVATAAPPLELRGRIATVDRQQHAMTLALDPADPTDAAATLSLAIPTPIDAAAIQPALDVAVTATFANGAYTLTGISADGDALAADDASAIEGDQRPSGTPSAQGSETTPVACALTPASRTPR